MHGFTPLYPLFLKVAGKRAVVVGGGPIGLHKAEELAQAGARVVVISDVFARELPRGAEGIARKFERGDTRGAFIVVAATGDKDTDEAVARDAHENGALVNVVDRSEVSDFYSGAVVRRGPLAVVVGTSGASPALARKVRERIEQVLPPGLGVLARVLGEARPKLLARFPVFRERAEVLDRFVERAWFRFVAGPSGTSDDAELQSEIEKAVEELLCASK